MLGAVLGASLLVTVAAAPRPPETSLVLGVGLLATLLAVPPLGYVLVRRRAVDPAVLGLLVLAVGGIGLASAYLASVWPYVRFPADIFIWSESDYVNDIIKFRLGYPLYTAQINNESFTYPPGSQLLTYALAWLAGAATSVPAYRTVQVLYTALSALIATGCVWQIVRMAAPGSRVRHTALWTAVILPFLFLAAGNGLTNPFVYELHNDSLGQLVTLAGYWLLLRYAATNDVRLLVPMVLVGVFGFLVKQNGAALLGFFALQAAVFQHPRSIKRAIGICAAGALLLGVVQLTATLLWGPNWTYWVIAVLGARGVSPLRFVQHIFQAWPYFALGLLGGLVLLRRRTLDTLLGPWLIWLGLLLLEAYSSATAWMLNHMGPGSLIAAVWFMAALVRMWPLVTRAIGPGARRMIWLRTGLVVAILGLVTAGLGMQWLPLNTLGSDANRYMDDIQQEFNGMPPDRVLLDVGSWVYVDSGVVQKDRAPSIGERGYSETGDFAGILERIRDKRYAKILVRGYNSPDFWYDEGNWRQSTGIRAALQANYHASKLIAAVHLPVGETAGGDPAPYLLGDVTVLVPNE
jgi:hypothetical protein